MAPSFTDENSLINFVVRDGNGVKGLVDLGLSEVPETYIQPPHERIVKLDDACSITELTPIDLSKLDGVDHERVADQIVHAAQVFGFFQVVNHGLPLELMESLKDAAKKFFGQPQEKKAAYRKEVSPSPYVKYGTSFMPEKEKSLEWKDFLSMVYTNDADALSHWPNECKEVALEYLKTSPQMVKKILKVLIEKLGVTLEDSKLENLLGLKSVNMNYYPPCPNPELTVGVGRHSDAGTITVVLQDEIGGLCGKLEEDIDAGKKEEWIEISPVPGALVIIIGDTLQIISNGRYKSAEHRVRTSSSASRVSVPMFTAPYYAEVFGPLPEVVARDGVARYRDVVFGDYLNKFFSNKHDGKNTLDYARIN